MTPADLEETIAAFIRHRSIAVSCACLRGGVCNGFLWLYVDPKELSPDELERYTEETRKVSQTLVLLQSG